VTGPIVAADLWREVVSAAARRCVCSGQCGRSHKEGMGRCLSEDSTASPLHAVPRGPQLAGRQLTAGDLEALCDGCHGRVLNLRQREAREAAAAVLAADQSALW
jgi:hypothetical protein